MTAKKSVIQVLGVRYFKSKKGVDCTEFLFNNGKTGVQTGHLPCNTNGFEIRQISVKGVQYTNVYGKVVA
jgi:hypothetical protein